MEFFIGDAKFEVKPNGASWEITQGSKSVLVDAKDTIEFLCATINSVDKMRLDLLEEIKTMGA